MYELQLEEADFTGGRMGEESSLQGSAPLSTHRAYSEENTIYLKKHKGKPMARKAPK